MINDDILKIWADSLQILKSTDSYREIGPLALPLDSGAAHQGQYVDFSSNDYLNLRNDPRLAAAAYESAMKSGSGAGASRVVLQMDENIAQLENDFCEFTSYSNSIFLPSGFTANLCFFDAISPFSFENISQEIFIDHMAHASLFFALKKNEIPFSIFKHNDYNHLEKKVAHSKAKNKIIIVESLYSMGGDFSDSDALEDICSRHNAFLFIDEGHSFGVYGERGSGWVQSCEKLKKFILGATYGCGKAVGVQGAFFATDYKDLKERFIQKSKAFIYSTAISPLITGAVRESLRIIRSSDGDAKRNILFRNQDFLIKNLPMLTSQSQIVPIILGSNQKAMAAQKLLQEQGIIAKAIRPPSVPRNTARLRVTLSARHTQAHMDKFTSLIKDFLYAD